MNQSSEAFCSQVLALYQSGNSYSEIAEQLGCSMHKVAYWLAKKDFPKRTRSQAMYSKYNPSGDPFKIRTPKTIEEAKMFGLGLGIYWGEGNKASPHGLRVANTDSLMILRFREFLKQICGVPEDKMHYNIVCFNDSNITEVSRYWAEKLEVSSQRFGKIVQIAPQGKGTYKHKSQFGVCTISVYNVKLKQWMMSRLKEL